MKYAFNRLMSALLALCMVVGAFSMIFTATLHVGAEETDEGTEVSKGDTISIAPEAKDLETILYATAEDKLRSMSKATVLLDKDGNPILDQYGQATYQYSPWIASGDYELYVQENSGEVAVKNTKTGQVLFSNPYDVRTNVSQQSLYKPMFAQINLAYEIIKEGKSGVMNSYVDAACYENQIKVSYIKNGVCVEYTIGRADQRRLVPMIMEKYRWETVLYEKMAGDPHIQKKFRAFYTLVDLDNEQMPPEEQKRYENAYAVLKKYHSGQPYTSENYDPSKEAEYAAQRYPYYAPINFPGTHDKANYVYGIPYQGRMALYVLGNATDQEKNRIEEYIRSWAPEYNYDTLAYDHELVQYTAIAAAIPLFKMALEYRLDDDGFSVRLPANSITFDEDNFRLNSVDVLPYMGAGNYDNNGYVFIPDGSGTLIRFEDAKNKPNGGTINNGMLYGPDNAYHSLGSYTGKNEEMRFPVFGIIENDKIVYNEGENGALTEACPHRYVVKKIEANCATKTNGGTYEFCAICGDLKSVENETPYAHTGTPVWVVKPNCMQEGKYTITCTTCKQTEEYTEPKTEHTYREFVVADTENHICYVIEKCVGTYETIDENGQKVTVTCGHVNEEFEMVEGEHTYEEEWTEYHKDGRCYRTNTCSECGKFTEEDMEHDLDEGTVVHDKNAHRCYTKYVCSACGGVVEEDLEHKLGEGTYAENADGLCVMSETCSECGFVQKTYGRHSAKDNGTKKYDKTNHYCYAEYTCELCNATFTEEIDHSMDNGTCTECGYAEGQTEKFVSENGKCYRVLLDKNGKEIGRVEIDHVYGSSTYVDAECIDPDDDDVEWGYTAFICVNCGHAAGKEYHMDDPDTAPTEHNWEWDLSNKTGCLDSYEAFEICTKCKKTKPVVVREPDGHVYDSGECLVQETTTNVGVYVYTCQFGDCGHRHYEIRDALTQDVPADDEDDAEEGEDTEGEEGEEGEEPVTETVQVEVPRNHGFLAIMTAGSALATLKAEYKNTHPYIYTYMTVNPRPQDSYNLADAISSGADAVWTVVSERKYSGSYSLKYIMLQDVDYSDVKEGTSIDNVYASTKNAANYAGMAAAYRNYLITTGALKPLDVNENGIPLYLEAFGATSIASSFLTFPTVETVPLTTFEDLKNIVGELESVTDDEGNVVYSITNLQFRLNGFTNGGMISTMPYKVEFEDVVGGNGGFKDFVSFAKDNKIGVYPDFDFAYVEDTDWFDGYSDSKHAVKTIDGRYIMKRDYDPTYQIFTGTGLTAISASVYDYFFDAFTASYSKFENTGVSVGSLGTDLNSDFDEDEPYNREDSREFTERMLANLQKEYGSVMINGGNAYAIPYADHVLNMSLNGSQQLVTSESIPFMSMVLHGCMNYAGTATNMASSLELEILSIIENGASPYFIIATQNTRYLKENNALSKYYSVDYGTWKDDMVETYKVLNENLKDVQGAQFVVHEYVNGYRLFDADDKYSQFEEASAIIIKAIEKYNKAVERYERAVALVERTTVTEVLNRLENSDKNGILDILGQQEWKGTLEESRFEALDVKLTEEQINAIKELSAEIEEYVAFGTRDTIKSNITEAKKALDAATEEYNTTMTQYGYLFKVKPDANGNYNVNDFRVLENFTGAVYKKDGKYVVAHAGLVDAEGNPVKSDNDVTDDTIVRVGYDNGVEFYLNYNYFDVVIIVNGQQIVIEGYDFVKVENK